MLYDNDDPRKKKKKNFKVYSGGKWSEIPSHQTQLNNSLEMVETLDFSKDAVHNVTEVKQGKELWKPLNICLIIVIVGQLSLILALSLATESFFESEHSKQIDNSFSVPEGYFDFLPNPENFDPMEYETAFENYLVLHRAKKAKMDIEYRQSNLYTFKELQENERKDCSPLDQLSYDNIYAKVDGFLVK